VGLRAHVGRTKNGCLRPVKSEADAVKVEAGRDLIAKAECAIAGSCIHVLADEPGIASPRALALTAWQDSTSVRAKDPLSETVLGSCRGQNDV
jgi:hypothetical protein